LTKTTTMTIYDNDLPPGVTKDSFLVNPYGSKHDGNMFHDPGLNKAYNHSSQGGSLGGSPTSTGRASPSAGYGYAPAGKPWPRWATAIILILFAVAILAYARYTMVVKRLAPYPQSEHVLLVGENLGVNPTGKSVADKYKAQLNLFKDQMAPLFPENASWENFYSGCGATLRCITHPIEVVERFRKNALAPDTFWNDLCNLTNYHRDDFPASVPLQWIIKTKVQNAGSYSPTTFSQCELSANSLREVNNYVTASRARWLLVGNMIFGVMFLVVLMGGWVWYSGGFPKWIRVGKSKNRVGASYMAKIAAYPRLEKWSAGDLRMVCGDRFFMAEAIRKFPGNYQYGSPEVREDVELARSAIVGSFLNIRYAPDSIKSNPDLVILACGNGSWSELKNASEKLRGDPDFMLRVLEYSQMVVFWSTRHQHF